MLFKLSPQMSFLFLHLPLLLPDSSFDVKNRNHKILLIKKHNDYFCCIISTKIAKYFFQAIIKGIKKIFKTLIVNICAYPH